MNGQDHKNVWDENGDYPIIGTGGEFGKANQYLHNAPSVILGRKGTIDKPQYWDSPFWTVDTAYYTNIPAYTNPKFFFYCCKTILFDLYKYGSAVPSMTQETLNQIQFATPPFFEQISIVNFLDKKIGNIEKLISNKQKLIELFKEERSAIISDAISGKGKNWERKKLKYIGKAMIGITYSPDDVVPDENGILVLRSSNVQNGKLSFLDNVFVGKTINQKYRTKAGDILICARNGSSHLVGKCALIDKENENLTWGAFMSMFRSEYGEYLYYYFNSDLFRRNIGLFSTSTVFQLTSDTLNNLIVAFPDNKYEMKQVIQYMAIETQRIDNAISKVEKEVKLMAEYQATLICEVVTGKIKVA